MQFYTRLQSLANDTNQYSLHYETELNQFITDAEATFTWKESIFQ